ncbi:MAG: radical SAM protein [Planctomycetes bacterium]|nr:radical SAM protein [Planctomycetota bacterium]
MLNLSHLLCGQRSGSEELRYGHVRTARSSGDPPRPVVVWALTQTCNLKCVHCYASAASAPAPDELSLHEGFALLEDLKAFGVPAVLFSGGEPLARPDALQLIGYARRIGLNATLSTNGLLINDRMADSLADLDLRYVGISLDGRKDVHDKLRGMRGAFDGTLAGIRRCQERGLKVGLRFTVHALNLQDLDFIFDFCLEQGIQRLCVYHLAYAGRGNQFRRYDLEPNRSRSVVERIMHRVVQAISEGHKLEVLTVANHADAAMALLWLERHRPERLEEADRLLRGTGGNRSGCHIASIGPRGSVHYDQFSWHYAVGNVRREPFSQIWTEARDPRLAILRDRQAHLPARCRACRFLTVCNGNLRTRAESATGDWLALDPACYLDSEECATIESTRVSE